MSRVPAGRPRLAGEPRDDAAFTLAGRLAHVHGGETRGIDQLRIQSILALRDLRVEDARALQIEVSPITVERRLRTNGAEIVECILIPREQPAVIVEWSAPEGADLELSWRLEAGWAIHPDEAEASAAEAGAAEAGDAGHGDAEAGSAGDGEPRHTLRARRTTAPGGVASGDTDNSAGGHLAFHLSTAPTWEVEDPEGTSGEAAAAEGPTIRARLRLEPGERARLTVVAAVADAVEVGVNEVDAAGVEAMLAGVDAEAAGYARAAAASALGRTRLAVRAPDPEAGEAIEWAVHRLDAYRADLPGAGRALVAGYGPAAARFIAHDAVWTALGALAAGDSETAREVIEFMGRHQDAAGRVPTLCTAAGEVLHDGPAASPLYLLLVARYLAWTGDIAGVRGEWPRVMAAVEAARAADADGDGLLERPSGGRLPSPADPLDGRATFHEAAIWTTALAELATAAESIGQTQDAERLKGLAGHARMVMGAAFRDAKSNGYASRLEDPAPGEPATRWRRDARPTSAHAVPLLLGTVDGDTMVPWLDAAIGSRATAYPLHAGWTAWAGYAAGRGEAAFEEWLRVVEAAFQGARGTWPERFGNEGDDCPDHAASTAMVVAPFVHGLLGAESDATRHRLRLRPQLPTAWKWLEARHLRIGDAEITFTYRREGSLHTYMIDQEIGGIPVTLILEPIVTGRVLAAMVDGHTAELDARPLGTGTLVPVQLVLDHPRTVEIHVEDHDDR